MRLKLSFFRSTALLLLLLALPLLLMAGCGGAVQTSSGQPTMAGSSWTAQTSGTTEALTGIAYGAGQFVAVGGGGYGKLVILVSSDGISWAPRSVPSSSLAHDLTGSTVVYGGGKFVAFEANGGNYISGRKGTIGSYLSYISSDGINWRAAKPLDTQVEFGGDCVTYGAGKFLLAGSILGVYSSVDGDNWKVELKSSSLSGPSSVFPNPPSLEDSNVVPAITYGADKFVAVGRGGNIYLSADGSSWSKASPGDTNNLEGVAHGAGKFVAVGDGGVIRTSPDGSNWTVKPSGTKSFLHSVTFNGAEFVAVGDNSTIVASPDGESWTSVKAPVSGDGGTSDLLAVVSGADKFVAVGKDGAIVTSASAPSSQQ